MNPPQIRQAVAANGAAHCPQTERRGRARGVPVKLGLSAD